MFGSRTSTLAQCGDPLGTATGQPTNQDRSEHVIVRQADGRTLRKSCDRCHQHKLQCARDTTLLIRCKRCQKAGIQCVYSARSSKKPAQGNINNDSWDNWPNYAEVPILNIPSSGLESTFSTELSQLNDHFPLSPLSWLNSGDTASLVDCTVTGGEQHATETSDGSAMSSIWLSAHNSLDAAVEMSGPADMPGRFKKVCITLEAMVGKVVEGQTKQDPQDYPIGEVLGGFDDFLEVLALDNAIATSTSYITQSPDNAHMRTQQALVIAQGYVICVRLMASLSEQMLQSLLALPLPSTSSSQTAPDAIHNAGTSEAPENFLSNSAPVSKSLRLKDLHVVPNSFGHALHSTIDMLHLCSYRLGRMEEVLGIPSEKRGGVQQANNEQSGVRNGGSPKLSLPARFIASIWEDEASNHNRLPILYLQRCRAAILGLSKHCS